MRRRASGTSGPGGGGLSVQGVSVSYGRGGRTVLDGVSLDVSAGQWLCLIGPNGAGKSSLLRAVAGLVGFRGAIGLGGVAVSALGARERSRRVAYVPQRPVLPPDLDVFGYAMLGRSPHVPYFGVEGAADRRVVGEVLARLDLGALSDRRLDALSGGEVQRVVLARALAQRAPLLLLDEPTSALDLGQAQRALELVDRLRRDEGLTVVSAMHDLTLAAAFADRLALLDAGRCVAFGPPCEVLSERLVSQHYGAAVTVTVDGEGRPVVVPVRHRPAVDAQSELQSQKQA